MQEILRSRLVVISNRLPIAVTTEAEHYRLVPASGGLVTALQPVLQHRGGQWIGWPGCETTPELEAELTAFKETQGYRLTPVSLTREQVRGYYEGFANETLWPLFHDLLGHCLFRLKHWEMYQEVNRHFAETIAANMAPGDLTWIHDYQLLLVGSYLRELGIGKPLAFFLHIPFPSLDLFRRLPWREALIERMLAYDLIGFQTLRDRRNFVHCVREMMPQVEADIRRRHTLLHLENRVVKVGHFPISIDFAEFDQGAHSQEVAEAAWYLHENLLNRQIVLGIDRLDYTKGVPQRFLAFERALEKYPELRKIITLLQVVVPSRTQVPEYQLLKEELDRLAGRINARFAEGGWIPIHYVFRHLDRTQLLAHYRTCEIALISPLRDGMNLVAKEYCASSIDNNGVLILSEFAGAADQLGGGALLVNPYDLEGTADAIYRAFTMAPEERARRMTHLRDKVRRNDVHQWVAWFLDAMAARGGRDFSPGHGVPPPP